MPSSIPYRRIHSWRSGSFNQELNVLICYLTYRSYGDASIEMLRVRLVQDMLMRLMVIDSAWVSSCPVVSTTRTVNVDSPPGRSGVPEITPVD
jgi:hypothetical protein